MLRVEWNLGKVIQEFTLWPNRPVIRIDYLKFGLNIVDLVTSVDAFEVYGAGAWRETRAKSLSEMWRQPSWLPVWRLPAAGLASKCCQFARLEAALLAG